MRRILATMTVLTCTLVGVTACSDDEGGGGSGNGDAETKIIKVRFADGKVTPNGERVEVGVDQPVEFVVAADEPGVIHIHSDPEHELEFEAGEEQFGPIQFDKPGVIEVESHDPDLIIVQLEVR